MGAPAEGCGWLLFIQGSGPPLNSATCSFYLFEVMLQFFIGLDHPATAWPFLRSMISVNTIRDRKGPFRINDWMMDSGGFTALYTWSLEDQPSTVRR